MDEIVICETGSKALTESRTVLWHLHDTASKTVRTLEAVLVHLAVAGRIDRLELP
jgi:hypothetical protein